MTTHPTITYPHLAAAPAAAHLDLLGGVIEDRIVASAEYGDEWLYDPEKLGEGEHERSLALFNYAMFNLVDEGLVELSDDGTPTATDEGRAWYEQMQADLEALVAIDEERVYLIPRPGGADGYLHAYTPTDADEFDGEAGRDLRHLRDAGVIGWEGDMVAFITTPGGEFLDAYRPELFAPVGAAA